MSKIKELKKVAEQFSLLYVEDNDELRESTAEIFRNLFKQVLVAQDGEEGLALYQDYFDSTAEPIDIVISDIQMPHMDGITLSKEIFKIHKDQKILIVSAYNDTRYLVELINIGVNGFMQKPLSSEQISSVLLEVCNKLEEERELLRFLKLPDGFQWDHKNRILIKKEFIIKLSEAERDLLAFFIEHAHNKFTSLEIFDNLYGNNPEKKFSEDSIKSLIKRLRKKIPQELIINSPQLGYSFQHTA